MKRFSVVFFIVATILMACAQNIENTTWSFSIVSLDGQATTVGEMVFYKKSIFINGTPYIYRIEGEMIFIDELGYIIKKIDKNNMEFIPAFGGERYIVKLKRKV